MNVHIYKKISLFYCIIKYIFFLRKGFGPTYLNGLKEGLNTKSKVNQVILIGIFLTLYILDVWEMSKVIKIEYIIYACFGLAVIDGIIIWSMIYSFHKIAKLNDNTTKDIIGNDINEAYLFGKVGVFLCDENGIILWVSDLFLERQMNYINQNIYECFPKLKDFDSNLNINSLNIRSIGYDYSVKYL